jgi:hypothetical protein
MAIGCNSLQGLQQRCEGHEGSSDHERPGPREAEHQGENEIANEVVDSQPSPERGVHSAGPRAINASRTKAATLQTFSMGLIVIVLGPLLVPPHIGVSVPGRAGYRISAEL